MPPTQLELLNHANHIDKLLADPNRDVAAEVPEVPGQKKIAFEDDPFNGNVNNRKVAERVAKEREQVAPSTVNPTGTSENPDKAAADVEAAKLAGNVGGNDEQGNLPKQVKAEEVALKPNFGKPAWTPNA